MDSINVENYVLWLDPFALLGNTQIHVIVTMEAQKIYIWIYPPKSCEFFSLHLFSHCFSFSCGVLHHCIPNPFHSVTRHQNSFFASTFICSVTDVGIQKGSRTTIENWQITTGVIFKINIFYLLLNLALNHLWALGIIHEHAWARKARLGRWQGFGFHKISVMCS